VYSRDEYTCQFCFIALTIDECTLDHLVPRCKGGTNVQTNLVTCCKRCNHLKDDREWPVGFMVDPIEALKKTWRVSA
jgi:5-methylcytosine-specific restriction endonuclease McrA